MIQPDQSTSAIRLARVTHVHPEGQSMDVIFLDTGDFGRNVQVVSPMAGTDFGFTSGIPSPEKEGHEPNLSDDPGKRTITCVVASAGGVNICLGFLFPQVNQMAFDKEAHKNRMIERHPSDFYRTVSDAGDADWVHPSGARLRIGSGEDADDLAGKDFDQRWAVKRNTGGEVAITLYNGGSTVQIAPNGDVVVDAKGDIQATAQGDITADAQGDISAEAQGEVTVTSASIVHLKAPTIYLDGAVVFGGAVSGKIGGGGVINMSASTINMSAGAMNLDADIAHQGDMNTSGTHTDSNGPHNA